MALNPNRKEVLTLIIVFAGVLLISALAVYFIGGSGRSIPEVTQQDQPPGDAIREPSRSATPQLSDDESFVDRLFGKRHPELVVTGRRSRRSWESSRWSRPDRPGRRPSQSGPRCAPSTKTNPWTETQSLCFANTDTVGNCSGRPDDHCRRQRRTSFWNFRGCISCSIQNKYQRSKRDHSVVN